MEKLNERNLYIRILEFGEKHPKGFTFKDLSNTVNPNDWENKVIKRYMYNAVLNESVGNNVYHETLFLKVKINSTNPLLMITNSHITINQPSEEEIIDSELQDTLFVLKYDAYFNYIDYRELREAMKNSKEARRIALWSIWIAILIGVIQVVVGIFQLFYTE